MLLKRKRIKSDFFWNVLGTMDQNLNLMTDDEALEYLAELSQFESDTDGEDIFDDDFNETVHDGDVPVNKKVTKNWL